MRTPIHNLLFVFLPAPARLLTIFAALQCSGQPQVNNLNDSGPGSLRAAIGASVDGETITFSNGLTGTIFLTSGELKIGTSIAIQGPGPTNLAVNGLGGYFTNNRVFTITGGKMVTIGGLGIFGGYWTDPNWATGGGILNNSGCTLTLSNCWIATNTAFTRSSGSERGAALGGGIYNAGALTLLGCTLNQNSALGGDDYIGPQTGNSADARGGGLYNEGSGTTTMANCTITGNLARGGYTTGQNGTAGSAYGGGFFKELDLQGVGFVSLKHCTVSQNSAQGGSAAYAAGGNATGGGMYIGGMQFYLLNTILASNTITAGYGSPPGSTFVPDYDGTPMSAGFNLIGQTNGDAVWIPSDLTSATSIDPLLGPLQNNGGPTPTMVPLKGSAAIDRGTQAGLATDQRGVKRPLGYPLAPGGDGSDIGAAETVPAILSMSRFGPTLNQGLITWVAEPGWKFKLLESSDATAGAGHWTTSSLSVTTIGGTNGVVINSPVGIRFFRLLAY
jgi:hypothetical protein